MSNFIYFPSESRGRSFFGWLRSYHSFSFGNYYNPELTNFGRLVVINDDEIAGGGGFDTHSHSNMEIITIPLSGALAHKDSTGGQMTLSTGEIQLMTAGTKISHSEINASETEPVTLLQIWVMPDTNGLTPGYQQKSFEFVGDEWNLIVSPDGESESLKIHQQSWFSMLESSKLDKINYTKHRAENIIFVFMIDGLVSVDGFETELNYRDALGIAGGTGFDIEIKKPSKILVIEVPR